MKAITRVCLSDLRHIAARHGFNLKSLEPEFLGSKSQTPTQSHLSTPEPEKIGPTAESQSFLDNFDMGNDVNGNDPVTVANEIKIAKLHKEIRAKQVIASKAESLAAVAPKDT